MYNLSHFKEDNPQLLLKFMRQHPLAIITGNFNNRSSATQVPLLLEEKDGSLYLIGHMMRKQDHTVVFEKNPDVLVIFTGPHAYVSASWYKDPYQASTWNYMTVHARGIMKFLDEKALEDSLQKLSLHFENNNPHAATVYENLPESYRKPLLKSIVAFEIKVDTLEHVFKLSQNKEESDFCTIIEQLSVQQGDAGAIATEMNKRKEKLFGK